MKKITILITCFLVALTYSTTSSAQTNNLFNGKDLTGWTIESNGQFMVENGRLKVNKGTGWLRSNAVYQDFKLTMKFRFLESGANSGIFVRTAATSKNDETGWPDNGYQIQCMDITDGDNPLGKMIPYGAPPYKDRFDQNALLKAYKPAGKWHTYEITCKGETLEVRLNKVVVTTATDIKNLEGHVGIQGEHGLLEFKKIKLKKL